MGSTSLLADKVAVVTGGGGGIGKGIALAFASHGAKVVVAERDPVRAKATVAEIEASGGRAMASVVDVQEKDQCGTLADAALREFGQVDVLVNNVGDYLAAKPFLETTEEDWEALYHINLKHVFLCTRAIAPRMIERGSGGSIINVSTVEAFRGIPHCAVYSAFKGGVTQFTKSFALEVAQYGIRVNAIAPDVTQTIQVPYDQWVPPEQRHLVPIWVPLGRFGMPDDIAGVAVFLASDLSRFVTGTTVHADGGTYAAGGWYRTTSGRWTNSPLNP
ncbi:MAG TPA: SDR family NAD(P)-dependent oxidoreductase [Candidatus Binatia bacterium]|jgi:NAD(P)-dependent dehydrogenase (short-subunit alcohol dehydrogenase family)